MMTPAKAKFLGLAALFIGATGIGGAPIWVRLSEVGPISTGFYRLFLSLPILWIWLLLENKHNAAAAKPAVKENPWDKKNLRLFVISGACFAGDLAFWHWSIKLTTIANSTLLTNFAPLFVIIGARFLLHERIQPAVVVGVVVALSGGALLVRETLDFGRDYLLGDFLAVVTAAFYAGYILTATEIRKRFSTATLMWYSGLVTCPLLLAAALLSRESIIPPSIYGIGIILGLALTSHILGQGMIGYALATLPASFSSVALMWQPVVSTLLAAWILDEPLTKLKLIGGAVVLAGILIASLFKSPR